MTRWSSPEAGDWIDERIAALLHEVEAQADGKPAMRRRAPAAPAATPSAVKPRPIFRQTAVESYRRRSERDIVPRLTSAPVLACFWALLAVLVAGAAVTWSLRVPSYVAAPGVVLPPEEALPERPPAAVLFLPVDRAADVRAGQHVRAESGSTRTYVEGVVQKVERQPVGPAAARDRYGANLRELLGEPSIPVIVRLRTMLPATAYAGVHVTARVETGSRRMLSLLPGLGSVSGGR
jgi:hypothetical protein